jgi:hypothetical protein
MENFLKNITLIFFKFQIFPPDLLFYVNLMQSYCLSQNYRLDGIMNQMVNDHVIFLYLMHVFNFVINLDVTCIRSKNKLKSLVSGNHKPRKGGRGAMPWTVCSLEWRNTSFITMMMMIMIITLSTIIVKNRQAGSFMYSSRTRVHTVPLFFY